MKKFILFTICVLLFSINGFSQTEITIKGDPNDSTFIKKKNALESKGFKVKIKDENGNDTPTGDLKFIKKHTNTQLPQFELKDIDGNIISSESLKGKLVHINFWSVTCKPCIEEFPELNELKKKYQDKGFVFLSFAPEAADKVNKVVSKFPLDYKVIAGAEEFYKELGIEGYPKNFFVNRDGVIIKVTDGTNYKAEVKNGEVSMIPDNFKIYDKIMQEME